MPPDDANETPAEFDPNAPIQVRRAVTIKGAPRSINETNRTVEVVFSTGARSRNYVPGLGPIVEELDMAPKAVRMGILKRGAAPVLNTHRGYDAGDVLGVVESARIENGQGVAVLRFSSAPDVDRIWSRIKDGTLRNVSVGYTVYKYETSVGPDGKAQVYRAVDWEPYEISVVPVPVDQMAGVRGQQGQPVYTAIEPSNEEAAAMPPENDPAQGGTQTPADANRGAAPTNPPGTPPVVVQTPTDANRAAPQAPANPAAPDPILVERARVSSIHDATRAAASLNIPAERITGLQTQAINEGWTAERMRSEMFATLLGSPGQTIQPVHNGNNGDDPASIIEAMAEAMAVRAMPGYKTTNARHAEFLGFRPTQMVAEMLRARGERNIPRDAALLAERSMHTTSDFPLLLSAAANKMLAAAYRPANPTYRQIFARRDFRDFKPHRFLRIGDFPNLIKLRQSGEIQAGTISENEEVIALETFARRIRVTRQVLINDDLGAFTDFASMIGRRVADFENFTAYSLLNLNAGEGPTLVQGAANVFTTGRGNKASSGTTVDLANVALGRAAVMKQTTLDGMPISVGDQMRLVVGPDRELLARQLTVNVAATQTSNANVLSGFISPLVEPLIPGDNWYLFSDPQATPTFVYGYLNGAEGPMVSTGPVSGIDGFEIAVVFDFGVGAVDYRGAWFNPGA